MGWKAEEGEGREWRSWRKFVVVVDVFTNERGLQAAPAEAPTDEAMAKWLARWKD